MQHDWKHVERPGGSHTALDGKKTRAVSILLCSIWDWRSWFEISIYESEWIYMKFRTLCVQCEALFGFMTRSECFQKHSLCSWVGMLWLHRFRKLFDLLEVYESDWDVFWIIHLDSWHGFVHLRCWWSLFCYHLRVFEILWHCEDNAYVSYLRYSGIVRTMPTYLIWDTPVLWGQCLRIFLGLWIFDLEVYFVIFASVAYSWRLVITVSELL